MAIPTFHKNEIGENHTLIVNEGMVFDNNGVSVYDKLESIGLIIREVIL